MNTVLTRSDAVASLAEDSKRFLCLADPAFQFDYKIKASGAVELRAPVYGVFKDLRVAVDHARAKQNLIPLCVKCRQPVPETNSEQDGLARRWSCPACSTSFLW